MGRCLRSELFDRSIFDKNRIITPMALHDLCGRRAVGSTSGHSRARTLQPSSTDSAGGKGSLDNRLRIGRAIGE